MPHLNWISIAKNQDNKKEYALESDKSSDKQLCKVKYIVGQSKNVIFITFQFKKKMLNPQMHRLRRQEGGRADGLPVGYRYQETVTGAKVEKRRRLNLSSNTDPKVKGLVMTSFKSVLFSAK